MKKIISLIILLLLVLSMSACVASKSTPIEDFEYEMSNGEVIITGYKGMDREIYIPSTIYDRPVVGIGSEAFSFYDLTHVTIPDSVKEIRDHAFSGCSCLNSIDFSKNLESIGWAAFALCNGLSEIDLPDSLKEIGPDAFAYCESLEKVSLPKKLEYLGSASFSGCPNLESLKIPYNTEVKIEYDTDYQWLDSPVGVSGIEELTTKLIISEGSYAYYQIKDKGYEAYGLKYEIK